MHVPRQGHLERNHVRWRTVVPVSQRRSQCRHDRGNVWTLKSANDGRGDGAEQQRPGLITKSTVEPVC